MLTKMLIFAVVIKIPPTVVKMCFHHLKYIYIAEVSPTIRDGTEVPGWVPKLRNFYLGPPAKFLLGS